MAKTTSDTTSSAMNDFDRYVCMQVFDPDSEMAKLKAVPPSNGFGDPAGKDPNAPALTLLKSTVWPKGYNLKIKFLDTPSTRIGQKIQQYANIWMEYANIKFNWVTNGDADIRITLRQGGGSNSRIGKQAQSILDQSKPTMNFGVVTHEFGHALGCVHEHVNPNLHITWLKEKVYDYFATTQDPPWSRAQVDMNFNNFLPLTGPDVAATAFDVPSIMGYPIHKDWNKEGIEVVQGTQLSETDKKFIAAMYPR